MSVGVVIVAGGRGERMGTGVPKQLLDLCGKSILQRSVALFDSHPAIDEIVVVLPADLVDGGAALAGTTRRPCTIVAGGERRQDSVRFGLSRISEAVDLVLVHDAARPFTGAAIIDRVIAGAAETGAAIAAVPSRDTVKRVDRGEIVSETLPRGQIWLAQTPQGFNRALLAAVVQGTDGGIEFTDEAMLVERAGHRVRVVMGDEQNVKITTREDLDAARARLSGGPRVGTGYDLHRLEPGRPLVLAGVTIASDRGPVSHSDGDVLCHALVDALFGAAGAGDIGTHFPNTDPRWKDSPGLDLLGRAVAILAERGFGVASADATVVLERPRLGPSIPELRTRLAGALGVPVDAVSVKAKTNEGVDAVGRGEAIAAHAVAVLRGGAR